MTVAPRSAGDLNAIPTMKWWTIFTMNMHKLYDSGKQPIHFMKKFTQTLDITYPIHSS